MDVAALYPLPLGVVRWRSPDPTVTVVVKATWCFDRHGRLTLSEEQEPLSLNQRSHDDATELSHASDFVPMKVKTDFLLVGGAYHETPSRVITAGFAVDDLQKRFYALAGEPATRIPLVRSYLRRGTSADSEVVAVGPEPAWLRAPPRVRISRAGVPLDPVVYPFDYGMLNAAPRDQQLNVLRSAARIRLEGLSPEAPWIELSLPSLRPRAFYVRRAGAALDEPPSEIVLRCDTLWIDTDRARLAITWRGVALPSLEDDRDPFLILTAQEAAERSSWSDIRNGLGRAWWLRAPEPNDLEPGAAPSWDDDPTQADPPPNERSELSLDEPSTEPTTARTRATEGIEPESRTASSADMKRTQPHIDASSLDLPVMPFSRPSDPEVTKVTAALAVPFVRPPTLPFVRADSAPAPPAGPSRDSRPAQPRRRDATSTITGVAAPPRRALPFEEGRTMDLGTPVPAGPEPPRSIEPASPPSKLDVPAARAEQPEPSLSVAEYAAVKAEIWHEGDLDRVLERHGIDLVTWREMEQRQLDALSRDAAEERVGSSLALGEALRRARERLARSRGR